MTAPPSIGTIAMVVDVWFSSTKACLPRPETESEEIEVRREVVHDHITQLKDFLHSLTQTETTSAALTSDIGAPLRMMGEKSRETGMCGRIAYSDDR